jgi:NADH-quinone oxidoreductase subunit L
MGDLFPVTHSYLIPLLPLLAAGLVALFGARVLKGQSHWLIWLGVGGSAVLSLWMLMAMVMGSHGAEREVYGGLAEFKWAAQVPFFRWIEAGGAGGFKADAAFWIDPLTAVMLSVVTGIGFLIMVFSAGYMHGEKGYWRFFASLGLFIFAMTVLVLADNLVLMFLGWEGVGLASYLLIGYYSDQPAAREAAKKAFVVNRIGDLGLAIGIMLIFVLFGTVSFFGNEGERGFLTQIAAGVPAGFHGWQLTAYHAIPYLLLLGCFGKSAQWPLFTWLPDAMAGPTPVSALIHAATMVTAGVYLVVRCAPMFYSFPDTWVFLGIVACFTSILTATIAMRQYDLKKVFAYSTVSQLGFMFVGAAALAPVAAIFHLVTHAFFKALLFLGSGVVMHATGGELDLRKMSGLKKHLPLTRWLVLIGCAALAGFPLITAGFYSKDEIVGNAIAHNPILGGLMLLCAALTAYYTFRLYFRVFEGEEIFPGHGPAKVSAGMALSVDPHGAAGNDPEEHKPDTDHSHRHDQHAHEDHGSHEPLILVGPLVLLAVGALLAGFLNFPKPMLADFLGQSPSLAWGFDAATRALNHVELNPEPFGQHAKAGELLAHGLPEWAVFVVSGVIAVAGIFLAYVFHLKNRSAVAKTNGTALSKVLEARYWLDEIYEAVVVKPLRVLARAMDLLDLLINAVVWGVSYALKVGAFLLSILTQRGYLQGYAVAMLIGLAIVLVLFFR